MTGPSEPGDDVLAQLADLFDTLDPVPSGLADRVAFSLELDELELELALIDSTLVGAGSARSADVTRTITFSSDTLSVMITVTAAGPATNRLDGWVTPGADLDVELRTPAGSRHERADATGRFAFASVPAGRVQFVVRPAQAGARRVVTPAVEL